MEEILAAEIMDSTSLTFVALVSALVQLSKRYINSDYAPLLSIAFGIFFSLGYYFSHLDLACSNWFIAVVRGIIIGLAASGLYSNINMANKRRSDSEFKE